MIAWIAACAAPESTPEPRGPAYVAVAGSVAFASDLPSVAVPYATAGDQPNPGELVIHAIGGSEEPISLTVTGPFAVEGDLGPLAAHEDRALVVRYTGPIDAPTLAAGTVTITADAQTAETTLAAVLGDPSLPAVSWETDAWGTHGIAAFASAPFPDGDASVWIGVPPQFSDPTSTPVATWFHGHYATLADTLAEQRVPELHAMSGRDAILVAPQGPVEQASGDFGQLDEPDGHARLVRDVVSVLYRDGFTTHALLGAQVLASHSGGYGVTANVLAHGGLPIDGVLLYDSLYGYVDDYAAYALDGGVLFSNWTDSGGTSTNNQALADDLAGLALYDTFAPDILLVADAVVGRTDSSHGACMTDDLTHARWLAASPLPPSPLAAPELISAVSDGAEVVVTWRGDRVPRGEPVAIDGSLDGTTWTNLLSATGTSATVPATPFLRLGLDSDAFAGSADGWLVVDGFDRVFGGSWTSPRHDFAARYGVALGGASTASNEAVASGEVDLAGFDHVLWFLGDEGTADVTFSQAEQSAVLAFLDGGGTLIVTGSELGWATDTDFLDALGIGYVDDDAGTDRAGGFTFGRIYPEDYPDVLTGDETLWTYETGGAAAVRTGRVTAVGFALETLVDADLAAALAALAAP